MSNYPAETAQRCAVLGEDLSSYNPESVRRATIAETFGDFWSVDQWVLKITKEIMLFKACRTKVMSEIAILIAKLHGPC